MARRNLVFSGILPGYGVVFRLSAKTPLRHSSNIVIFAVSLLFKHKVSKTDPNLDQRKGTHFVDMNFTD